jgi:DNA repair exonuclease SbcCD nuclease subunit
MMLIINDVHLGAVRKGGTTPETQAAIRKSLQDSLRGFLWTFDDSHLVVNGDLFDAFSVEPTEVVLAYETFSDWLHPGGGRRLTLGRGNHDWNPRGDKLSSFNLLAHFLVSRFGEDRVQVVSEGYTHVSGDVWMIPHMPNQDLFDMEIAKALMPGNEGGKYLLLHCNYCSTFAEHSDHSLNISPDQVTALAKAGWHLILGHEHQGRRLPHATIVGNQWPSSVSDCLSHGSAQKDGKKSALRIEGGELTPIPTWDATSDYVEMDWRELNLEAPERFIRVTGDAAAAEAEAAVSAVARFRQKSKALVITNAVKVEGVSAIEGFEGSIQESIKSFDVLSALLEELSEKEAEVVKGLMQ